MSQPRITVVISSFNHGQFIERAICSVLDQAYDNLELIVVDRGSIDESVTLIRMYEADLSRFVHQPDTTASQAINTALALASGDYITVLHGDELFEPHALENIANHIENENAPEWISGCCVCLDTFDMEIGQIVPKAPESLAQFLMRDSGHFSSAGTFFQRDLIEKVGMLDTKLSLAYMYDLWCRFMASEHEPSIVHEIIAGRHEYAGRYNAERVLVQGRELIDIAERYTSRVPMSQRYALWANCDQRRRIYALAQAEADTAEAQSFMLAQLLRHPWWLADHAVRQTLLHGPSHPLPHDEDKRAAA